jgi:ParB/RepB/Spo0J family partition protein
MGSMDHPGSPCPSCGSSLPPGRPARLERVRCGSCRSWSFGEEPPAETSRPAVASPGLLGMLGRWAAGIARALLGGRGVRRGPFEEIPVASISVEEIVPRRSLDLVRQRMLERSVARFGILVPLVVRPVTGGHELVTGHRRLLAARRAGLRTVPAVVRKMSRREAEAYRYLENSAVDPPGPIEEAEGFERIFLSGKALGRKELARRLGIEPSWISGRLELLSLPRVVQDALLDRTIGIPEARALARLESAAEMARWIERFSRGEAAIADLMEYFSRDRPCPEDRQPEDDEDPLGVLEEALDERHA